MAEGDLPQARKNLEHALQIRTEIGEISNVAATRLQLAALSIEEGNSADAERVALEVREEFHKEAHPDDEIGADAVLLRALLAENKSAEAEQEFANAKLLLAKSQNVPNHLSISIAGAEIQADSGKTGEALLNLSAAARDAAKSGLVSDQLEARLAHAGIERRSGKAVARQSELAGIKKDAAEKGFGLIAQKATELMNKK